MGGEGWEGRAAGGGKPARADERLDGGVEEEEEEEKEGVGDERFGFEACRRLDRRRPGDDCYLISCGCCSDCCYLRGVCFLRGKQVTSNMC